MANAYRNEVTITLNGNEYLLRPTFDCLAEIEDHFGETILFVISEILGKGKLSVKNLFFIISAGLKGAGQKLNAAAIDDLKFDIVQTGTVTATHQVATFLSAAIQSADALKKN